MGDDVQKKAIYLPSLVYTSCLCFSRIPFRVIFNQVNFEFSH